MRLVANFTSPLGEPRIEISHFPAKKSAGAVLCAKPLRVIPKMNTKRKRVAFFILPAVRRHVCFKFTDSWEFGQNKPEK
jgi:hypothetical protein